MTLEEIDTLIEDTKRLPRVADKVAQATALGVLEVARQLAIFNANVAGLGLPKADGKPAKTVKMGK